MAFLAVSYASITLQNKTKLEPPVLNNPQQPVLYKILLKSISNTKYKILLYSVFKILLPKYIGLSLQNTKYYMCMYLKYKIHDTRLYRGQSSPQTACFPVWIFTALIIHLLSTDNLSAISCESSVTGTHYSLCQTHNSEVHNHDINTGLATVYIISDLVS